MWMGLWSPLCVLEWFTAKAYTSASPASWIKVMWWICRKLKKMISALYQHRVSFSLVFLCHSAAMLMVKHWFNCGLSPIPSHSEILVCACCCSLFDSNLFHAFRTLLGPLLFSSLFLSLPASASMYFISACADARQSEDTGDEAVTCCLHLALNHQQLRLQIYFPVDCGHRNSW